MNVLPLTCKQQRFAEQNHDLVYAFLNENDLPVSDYYDIVIFGYLSAVQRYLSDEHLQRYQFSTVAWKQMNRSLSNYYKYLSRPKRCAPTVSFDEPIGSEEGLCWEDIISRPDSAMMQLETELLLHALASNLPKREMRIIRMKVRGDRMHDIAKAEHLTFRNINKLLAGTYPTVISVVWG